MKSSKCFCSTMRSIARLCLCHVSLKLITLSKLERFSKLKCMLYAYQLVGMYNLKGILP